MKKSDLKSLERIYRRRIPKDKALTAELAKYMAECSGSIGRQVGVLADRSGNISHVIVGDAKGIFIPGLADYPLGRKVLRGLRLIHTHLKSEKINRDDITDLSLLRLDAVIVVGMKNGQPYNVSLAYLFSSDSGTSYEINSPIPYHGMEKAFKDFDIFISSIEKELRSRRGGLDIRDTRERAVLVSVSTAPRFAQEDSIEELKELAKADNVVVVDTVLQRPKSINPKYLMGEGKIKDLVINAMNKGATLLIFDQDLNPSQIKSIGDITELKVIDRSQLILDIFARRAHSKDGKVQVELAQLRYRLPRLTGKGTAMSRLMGGIGGRGPGEMKLEVDRRRVREKIALLEKQLKSLSRARQQRKARRVAQGIPIISIIGYTNAGKSTLLNNLTRSKTFVEDRMFATLDTASRRLRFPKERDVIITDTVGFIRNLPKDLFAAFKSTLEELEDADLLLHIVDISNPRFEQQINSVEKILSELGLSEKPVLLAFNKEDLVGKEEAGAICTRFKAVSFSALNPGTFQRLIKAIESKLWPLK
ncbi:MAG TPA: GTPase HflX [Nitrospirae bacterium]|nr:GTPase HflX [bacterium BMS3Abin06]HDH13449.1 GTPase HflX [Nitrospirota bacterium]HDZ01841.1 GTPase HflX [Nitrospirota bacterium]